MFNADAIGSFRKSRIVEERGTDPLGYTSIFAGGNDVVRSKSQSNQTGQTAPPPYGAQ